MSKKLLLLIAAASLLLIFWFWPQDEEKRIRLVINQLVALSQVQQPLTLIECRIRAKELTPYFADSLSFQYFYENEEYKQNLPSSRLVDLASGVCLRVQKAEGAVSSIKITQVKKDNAEVRLFFAATWREQGESEDFTAGEDLTLQMEKIQGEWKIIAGRNWARPAVASAGLPRRSFSGLAPP